jgi:hypothetical protein
VGCLRIDRQKFFHLDLKPKKKEKKRLTALKSFFFLQDLPHCCEEENQLTATLGPKIAPIQVHI